MSKQLQGNHGLTSCGLYSLVLDFKAEGMRFNPWLGHGHCTLGQDTLHVCLLLLNQEYKCVPTLVHAKKKPEKGHYLFTNSHKKLFRLNFDNRGATETNVTEYDIYSSKLQVFLISKPAILQHKLL